MELLTARCLGMAGIVQLQVTTAVEAILKLDLASAKKVLAGERAIDDLDVEIERLAINLMLLHHPAAADFRAVFGIVKINADLERIGDCAVNIAQQVGRVRQGIADYDITPSARGSCAGHMPCRDPEPWRCRTSESRVP